MYPANPISLYDNNGNRKYLNNAERDRLYKVLKNEKRDKKLFYLMLFWSGARISEILNLKTNSIDFSDKVVIIESLKKRRKGIYRQIPLPSYLLSELKAFVQNIKPDERIWRWSRRTASRYIKSAMASANISGAQSSSKGLRHSFAVHCVLSKVPLTLIQKWMGHSSLSTTAIYLNIVGEEERKFAKDIWKNR